MIHVVPTASISGASERIPETENVVDTYPARWMSLRTGMFGRMPEKRLDYLTRKMVNIRSRSKFIIACEEITGLSDRPM